MPDLAQLDIVINSKDVSAGNRELNSMVEASRKAEAAAKSLFESTAKEAKAAGTAVDELKRKQEELGRFQAIQLAKYGSPAAPIYPGALSVGAGGVGSGGRVPMMVLGGAPAPGQQPLRAAATPPPLPALPGIGGRPQDDLAKYQSLLNAFTTGGATSQINALTRSFQGVGAAAETSFASMALRTVGVTAAIYGAYKGVNLLKDSVGVFAERELITKSFEAMVGSGEKASRVLDQVRGISRDAGLAFETLAQATRLFVIQGVEVEKVPGYIKNITNAALATGASEETLQRINKAFTDMAAKQRISGEELRQLGNAGIPIGQTLAKVLGTDLPTALKHAEQNTIDFSKVFGPLLDQLGQDTAAGAAGGMDTLSKSADKAGNAFKDASEQVGGIISDFTGLKSILQGTADVLGAIADKIQGARAVAGIVGFPDLGLSSLGDTNYTMTESGEARAQRRAAELRERRADARREALQEQGLLGPTFPGRATEEVYGPPAPRGDFIRENPAERERNRESLAKMLEDLRNEATTIGEGNAARKESIVLLRAERLAKDDNAESTKELIAQIKLQAQANADAAREQERYRGIFSELKQVRRSRDSSQENLIEMISQLRVEREALGKTNEERQFSLTVLRAEELAKKDLTNSSGGLVAAVEKEAAALRDSEKAYRAAVDLANTLGDAFGSAADDIAFFEQSIENTLENLYKAFASDALKGAVKGLLNQILTGSADGQGGSQVPGIIGLVQSALVGLFSGGGGSGEPIGAGDVDFNKNARGNVYQDGNLVPFAMGGGFSPGKVLDRPTYFPMSGGKRGVAGEAGLEAAFAPLARMPSGRLGVETNAQQSAQAAPVYVTQNITIKTPDAQSFHKSRKQTLQDLTAAAQGAG